MYIAIIICMNRYYAILVSLLIMSLNFPALSAAQKDRNYKYPLKIRSGSHSKYHRIVFQGHKSLITTASVKHEGNKIIVSFKGKKFKALNKSSIPLDTKREKVIFLKDNIIKVNSFFLEGPSRYIVDLYKENKKIKSVKKNETPKKKVAGKTPVIKKKNKKIIKVEKKKEQVNTKVASAVSKKIEKNRKTLKRSRPRASMNSLIPEEYKEIWGELNSGQPYNVIKKLNNIRPDREELLSPYHYIYAESYKALKDYMTAVDHYRLAYIFSKNDLREKALLKRADLYMKLKFREEARADYLVFLKEYPDSPDRMKVRLKLAKCLEGMKRYGKAVKEYRKSGDSPEAMFGIANSLQKQGRTSEASKMYEKAMLSDDKYINKSVESRYLLGENKRLMGKYKEAEKLLSTIKTGIPKDRADLSLGLIAIRNSNFDTAEKKFRSAAKSKERIVKAKALYYLSWILKKDGKHKEAISKLEDIRAHHIGSRVYKDTVLELSRLYRKDGNRKKSVSLLKELVYGINPPEDAYKELENILIDASKQDKTEEGEIEFTKLWKEVGLWLLDESREEFLLGIADKFKGDRSIFINIATWIVNNGSINARNKAALELADYFAGIGETGASRTYIDIAKSDKEAEEKILLIEAKIHSLSGEYGPAYKKLAGISKFGNEELELLGELISGMKKNGLSQLNDAIALYEKNVNEKDHDAGVYTILADILYGENKYARAMKYYRVAYKKKPEDEWVTYRIGRGAGRKESSEMFAKLEKGDSLVSQIAKIKLMEFDLMDKVEEVY